MQTIAKIVVALIATALTLCLVALIIALPVMWLTNYVLSPAALAFAFGGPLTFWKALGFAFLIGCLTPSVKK